MKQRISNISAESNIKKEIFSRIGLATQAFNRLQNIWKSSVLNTNFKLKIYKYNIHSILIYASEIWKTNTIKSRLSDLKGHCL